MMIYLACALMAAIDVTMGFVKHQSVYFSLAIIMAGAAATLAWVRHVVDNQVKAEHTKKIQEAS